jgi:hypothetical protein
MLGRVSPQRRLGELAARRLRRRSSGAILTMVLNRGISLRLEGGHDPQPGFSIHCRKHVGVASDLLKVSFRGQIPGCFVRLFIAGKEIQKAIRKMRTSSGVDLKSRSIKANAPGADPARKARSSELSARGLDLIATSLPND